MARQRAVGQRPRSDRPGRTSARWPRASSPASGDACTPAAQIFVRARDPLGRPSVGRSRRHRTRRRRVTTRPGPDRHARAARARCAAFWDEPVTERRPGSPGRRRRARPARSAGSMRRKLPVQAGARQLGDLTGDLDTRSAPPPTTTKVSHARARLGIVLDLGHLEGTEDPPAQLQGVVDRLHARREAGELVVAEVRLRRRRPRRSGCRTRRCAPCSSGRLRGHGRGARGRSP